MTKTLNRYNCDSSFVPRTAYSAWNCEDCRKAYAAWLCSLAREVSPYSIAQNAKQVWTRISRGSNPRKLFAPLWSIGLNSQCKTL